MTHRFAVRVYYEDTDMGGIVYYANFLKFIERARSDMVAGLGLDQNEMLDEGVAFAVRRIEADYLRPARFADELEVSTQIVSATGARLVLDQRVLRGDETLFAAQVTIAAISAGGRPVRLPDALRAGQG
ncbi:tol-pal system-associated acyl-CoA thioesterase [Roseovarius amoyensis]|uniref:tol-pal system-associated acyl-CoA thioesterase n=1 Tax=Roseovarius amoyensis TaxID=2211448 RepID=UPI000DBE89D8|nr:tol-pal system-associated acyl-CoA thioesterase [Roseovarius amoyensis]